MSIFQKNILEGHTAFVTGGGSGIGKTIVRRFMEHGANVVIASIAALAEPACTWSGDPV